VLTSVGRRVRGGATILVLGALLAGSVWGDDDHFPFGPFRMYSTRTDPHGTVRSPAFEARDVRGKEITLSARSFGLRPAEVLGQYRRFRRNPALLSHLADMYERFNPDASQLSEITFTFNVHHLRDGRRVRTTREVVASWSRP
jgi:hypothetical protein